MIPPLVRSRAGDDDLPRVVYSCPGAVGSDEKNNWVRSVRWRVQGIPRSDNFGWPDAIVCRL